MKRILLAIFLLALLLRFNQIETVPACMNWDEASFLFNAKSILETGRDEYGEFLPLQFKSVGDYKFPGFIYMLVPVIKIFGDNIFAVRFLPAILGSLAIFVIYGVAKILTKNKNIALLSSFLLAISPWHLQFTRAGADVGVSTFFVLLGVFFTLLSLESKALSFKASSLSFATAIYTYFTDRIFIPLFLLATFLTNPVKVLLKKNLARDILFFLVLLLPAIYLTLGSGQNEKFLKTTVFGQTRPTEYIQNLAEKDTLVDLQIYHNGFYEKLMGALDHYLSHFSPLFLFTQGAGFDLRQLIYGMGVMYIYELPFLIYGLYYLIKKNDRNSKLLLFWLLVAPIPSSITRDPVHARRSLNMVYPILILAAIGIEKLLTKRRILIMPTIFAMLFFVGFYLTSYYVFTPQRVLVGPAGFNCGYKELAEYISTVEDKYEHIVVDTSYQGAYLYFLLHTDYRPTNYQKQASLVQESKDVLGESSGFDKYEFRAIYWPGDRHTKNVLFAGPPEKIPLKDIEGDSYLIKKIYFYDGTVAFHVVEVK